MSGDLVAVRYRYFKRGGVWREVPFPVSVDRLDVLMAVANRHFSEHPERDLGGPRMPKEPR